MTACPSPGPWPSTCTTWLARARVATHYHELCDLHDSHPRVHNVSVAAREWKGEVVFLRKLTPGGTSRSFGIEVAKLPLGHRGGRGRARTPFSTACNWGAVHATRRPDEPRPGVAWPGRGAATRDCSSARQKSLAPEVDREREVVGRAAGR